MRAYRERISSSRVHRSGDHSRRSIRHIRHLDGRAKLRTFKPIVLSTVIIYPSCFGCAGHIAWLGPHISRGRERFQFNSSAPATGFMTALRCGWPPVPDVHQRSWSKWSTDIYIYIRRNAYRLIDDDEDQCMQYALWSSAVYATGCRYIHGFAHLTYTQKNIVLWIARLLSLRG